MDFREGKISELSKNLEFDPHSVFYIARKYCIVRGVKKLSGCSFELLFQEKYPRKNLKIYKSAA